MYLGRGGKGGTAVIGFPAILEFLVVTSLPQGVELRVLSRFLD